MLANSTLAQLSLKKGNAHLVVVVFLVVVVGFLVVVVFFVVVVAFLVVAVGENS